MTKLKYTFLSEFRWQPCKLLDLPKNVFKSFTYYKNKNIYSVATYILK